MTSEMNELQTGIDDLVMAHDESAFPGLEKEQRAAKLLLGFESNQKLALQNSGQLKRAAEMLIAQDELAFRQNAQGLSGAEPETLAAFDLLTGLPNRHLLKDRLHHSLIASARNGKEGALLLIGPDDSKDINNTFGHYAGDRQRQQIAERLLACVGNGDTVARLDDQEFVVMLENLEAHPVATVCRVKAISEKILVALSQPYQLGTHDVRGSASIGATFFSDYSNSTEELLQRAGIAMRKARTAGKGRLCCFNQKMQDLVTAQLLLEPEMCMALDRQQFQLYYQIQMDGSQHCRGAEALIRWNHPVLGLAAPVEFNSLAEATGQIGPIGSWALEAACTQLKAWEQNEVTRNLVLSINVSATQFHEADFVAQVQALIARHAIDETRLKLEITEGLLLQSIENSIVVMSALRAIGIHCTLVRAIIALARSLELDVMADGVETSEQLGLLHEAGCKSYQHSQFGKPMPIDQFDKMIKQGSLD